MMVRLLVALSLISSTAFAAGPVPAQEDKATQSLMQTLLAPMVTLLPLSFDLDAFSGKANHERVEAHLKVLRDNATKLEQHARQKDRAFEFVARSLREEVGRSPGGRGSLRWPLAKRRPSRSAIGTDMTAHAPSTHAHNMRSVCQCHGPRCRPCVAMQ